MGVTVQQLGEMMTAQEFGQHYLLEQVEPLHATAQWPDPDALAAEQAQADTGAALTVEQIKARGRAAGMVI